MRIASAAKRELSSPCADQADSAEIKLGLSDGRRVVLFHVLRNQFLETAGAKAVPECRHPHFQHLHLLVVCHCIDLALHNFQPLNQGPADDGLRLLRKV